MKRTLARCRKFEDMGISCFGEAALQDVLFSAAPCGNDAKSADCVGSGTASNTCNEARGSGMQMKLSLPFQTSTRTSNYFIHLKLGSMLI